MADIPTISVLFIDSSMNQRTYWADQLKRCSSSYEILEASDAQSGLDLYRSRRIDCVVLDLALQDESNDTTWGLATLVNLVPIARKPSIAVIVLTQLLHRGVWEIAKQNGAYACLAKMFTSGEDLDEAIRRAVAFVSQVPKEDRYSPI